nr:TSL-kinase interacting protein 1 isoform X1 [Tanacetum cinerariifolium]
LLNWFFCRWSLLEKHSCKASKLHLKPRRFKIFKENLEHQLLKDRKKNIRKRLIQGENSSLTPSNAVSNQGGACTQDAPINLVDIQTTQNLNSGKGSSLRRNANTCLDRKGDLSAVKQARQRRRPGNKSLDPVARDIPPVPHFHQTTVSAKLKLQLFPINKNIRRALEMDNHNPHLELTLSSRKKILSVLEHINRKWGSCSIASGELRLLPYYAQSSNLESCKKWTQDSVLSAADVWLVCESTERTFTNSCFPKIQHDWGRDRKGDLSAVKQARQRRRPGTKSTAAYKRWEKAAIAGVSLVADAAEHLEQTALDRLVDAVQHMQRNKSLDPVARDIPPVPHFHQTTVSAKLKLQLFPINKNIRRALEMVG